MAPTTIPAMAPPDRPFFVFDAAAVAEADAEDEEDEEVGDAVGEDVEKVMNAVIVGRTTPAHLFSALEL
jgi:hypothetical protein